MKELEVSDETKLAVVTEFFDSFANQIGLVGCAMPLVIMDALDKLVENNVISEVQYAEYFATSNQALEHWSELLGEYGRRIHAIGILLGIVSDEEIRQKLDEFPISEEDKQAIRDELLGDAYRTED